MNLFDQLVQEALKNNPELSTLKIVVEKELLHHDILRVLSRNGLLVDLTFIGGTALRSCYGGIRLSEDLDFTGGANFSRNSLSEMGAILEKSLYEKYGLQITITEPEKDKKNVDTWKIKVITRPKHKHMPAQRINIDICAVPSYEKQPMVLLNPYGVDMGTSGLIIQTQSKEEIYTDKLLAFALRPNRIKHRDLWDIVWLHQQSTIPNFALIVDKLEDRKIKKQTFGSLFEQRLLSLQSQDTAKAFQKEMERFLPQEQMNILVLQNNMWAFIGYQMQELNKQVQRELQK